jgi:hypothetical protein
MIVDTCQCFGGPAPQPPDAPSPGRCTLRGQFWATVPVDPRVARPEHGADRVVVLACPYHSDTLGQRPEGS